MSLVSYWSKVATPRFWVALSAEWVPVGVSEDGIRNNRAGIETCRGWLRLAVTVGCSQVKPADLLGNAHHSHIGGKR